MTRRKIYLLIVVVFLVGVSILSYIYFGPITVINIGPLPTSIFTGNVDIDLINKLRATQSDGEINRDQAIGLAELYCAQMNSSQSQINPYHIRAIHLTEAQATHRLMVGQYSASSNPVWYVSMDGQWEHVGGPLPPTPGTPPLIFKHCNVIIDAKTALFGGGTN